MHVALSNPELILFWNSSALDSDGENELVDALLGEVDELLGCIDREPLVEDLVPWHADILMSGARVEDRRVYRLTPRSDGELSARDLVRFDGTTLTLSSGNTTIAFEHATLHDPPTPASELGVWVLQWDSAPVPDVDIAPL